MKGFQCSPCTHIMVKLTGALPQGRPIWTTPKVKVDNSAHLFKAAAQVSLCRLPVGIAPEDPSVGIALATPLSASFRLPVTFASSALSASRGGLTDFLPLSLWSLIVLHHEPTSIDHESMESLHSVLCLLRG
eukprot:CAMPEP_0172914980 /NCGR_PEP_ID=MMETSP1075-20121228/193439_1 /TAXON_ID=2916 /ORGANISM="Ceratium fusus, Strain PA161109" /LENGTH=131 /DNA_ID=CAMNT_0013773981 /DNA_START=117 /DNA_END=512 /DNA_ORIENTATION=-